MVWTIAILCVSLSCEPLPIMLGWFFEEEDCLEAGASVMASWKPTMGYYQISCVARVVL